MKQFSEKLYAELNEELEKRMSTEEHATKKLTGDLAIIRSKIRRLREFVAKQVFNSPEEEIYFFKYIKPSFYSLLIYRIELFAVESSRPSSDQEKILAYYIDEVAFIDRFFRQHSFHYEYYRLDASELDNLYFIRGENHQSILLPETPEPHAEFSTSCDYLFSKFRAMEMLKDVLLEKITGLKQGYKVIEELPEDLKWTGDKVNLAEIIYGIYFTGQVNHGKAELSTLVKWLGRLFQIDLKRIYSDYKDIRNRKIASPTRYLDQMRSAMHQRIDDENAFKPKGTVIKREFP